MDSIILLAFIQGISEFLPISSSAHLIIFRDLFLIGNNLLNEDIRLTFDVALHFGTALSIIVFFYNDFKNVLKNNKLIWIIIIATIPGALFGFLFEDIIENYIRNKFLLIAFSLIIMGFIIYFIDNYSKQEKSIDDINVKDAIIIGFSQVFALVPGFSRSGTTISSARLLKVNRVDSAKFSFFLSIPIVLGATLLELSKNDSNILISYFGIFILGILISFTTGLICIKFLLNYLNKNNFKIFMWYRIIFGIIIIGYFLFN